MEEGVLQVEPWRTENVDSGRKNCAGEEQWKKCYIHSTVGTWIHSVINVIFKGHGVMDS